MVGTDNEKGRIGYPRCQGIWKKKCFFSLLIAPRREIVLAILRNVSKAEGFMDLSSKMHSSAVIFTRRF